MKRAGVVDIGSNSIKLLVMDVGGAVVVQQTEEVRISKGITAALPRLSDQAMLEGAAAVARLTALALDEGSELIRIVATSAVRDAVNRDVFARLIEGACSFPLEVLSGEQEAAYVAQGVAQDPALADCADFMLADLGGGSMEVLRVHERVLQFACSLQIGAVRYLERHAKLPGGPLEPDEIDAICGDTLGALAQLPADVAGCSIRLVLTGGAVTFARKVLAEADGQDILGSSSRIPVEHLKCLLRVLAPMSAQERVEKTHLPVNRADIMPVALAILITLADYFKFSEIQHSFYNLKYGVAAEILELNRKPV